MAKKGEAYLAIPHDEMSVNIQFHDICVYPSLWGTVYNQHHLMEDNRKCGKREGSRLRQEKETYHFTSSRTLIWVMTKNCNEISL